MPGGATHRVGVPADLDAVRASYDRVADRYVAMGLGELDAHPWLRAVLAAFAEEVGDRQPDRLAALLAEAGLELVAELRLPVDASGRPQVALAARRPG